MTLKEDLDYISNNIDYLYAPGSHHTTIRIIPAARLYSMKHKNKLSHGKPVLNKKIHELQQAKNMILKTHIPYSKNMKLLDVRLKYNLPFIARRDLKTQNTFLHNEFTKVQSVIVWNFRSILDRIGELDRPGSFMDIYIKNGPICISKPTILEKGASTEKQNEYKKNKKKWIEDNKKGYESLRNLESHVHQIWYASSKMYVLFDIYQKYLYMYGQETSEKINTIYRISKWIHDRYSLLEQQLKFAVKCQAPENKAFYISLQEWRTNKFYKYLISFLLKKYVGFYNQNEQNKYLSQINMTNKYL